MPQQQPPGNGQPQQQQAFNRMPHPGQPTGLPGQQQQPRPTGMMYQGGNMQNPNQQQLQQQQGQPQQFMQQQGGQMMGQMQQQPMQQQQQRMPAGMNFAPQGQFILSIDPLDLIDETVARLPSIHLKFLTLFFLLCALHCTSNCCKAYNS